MKIAQKRGAVSMRLSTWSACSISITLLTILTLSGCSGLDVQARSPRSTKLTPIQQDDDQFPKTPAEKFCNPDFSYSDDDSPVLSRCAPIESFVCDNHDPWHVALSQRCIEQI